MRSPPLVPQVPPHQRRLLNPKASADGGLHFHTGLRTLSPERGPACPGQKKQNFVSLVTVQRLNPSQRMLAVHVGVTNPLCDWDLKVCLDLHMQQHGGPHLEDLLLVRIPFLHPKRHGALASTSPLISLSQASQCWAYF